MNKLEKLREVNLMLNKTLVHLETYLFINNIDAKPHLEAHIYNLNPSQESK